MARPSQVKLLILMLSTFMKNQLMSINIFMNHFLDSLGEESITIQDIFVESTNKLGRDDLSGRVNLESTQIT